MPIAVLQDLFLVPRLEDGVLRFEESKTGRSVTTTIIVDGETLNETWLTSIERADASARPTA
jgi:hypothetical protein